MQRLYLFWLRYRRQAAQAAYQYWESEVEDATYMLERTKDELDGLNQSIRINEERLAVHAEIKGRRIPA
jgi:hypothetical protein